MALKQILLAGTAASYDLNGWVRWGGIWTRRLF